jgi:hypothetical protein
MHRATTLLAIAASMLLGCARSQSVTIEVWADRHGAMTQAEAEARGISLHPCGASKRVRVSRLAPDNVKGTNTVVELDANGQVLNRWATPIDVMPVAVRGRLLYVATQAEVLEISIEGNVRVVPRLARDPGRHEVCQQALDSYRKEHNTADACWIYLDSDTGQSRNIAFPLICT